VNNNLNINPFQPKNHPEMTLISTKFMPENNHFSTKHIHEINLFSTVNQHNSGYTQPVFRFISTVNHPYSLWTCFQPNLWVKTTLFHVQF